MTGTATGAVCPMPTEVTDVVVTPACHDSPASVMGRGCRHPCLHAGVRWELRDHRGLKSAVALGRLDIRHVGHPNLTNANRTDLAPAASQDARRPERHASGKSP